MKKKPQKFYIQYCVRFAMEVTATSEEQAVAKVRKVFLEECRDKVPDDVEVVEDKEEPDAP